MRSSSPGVRQGRRGTKESEKWRRVLSTRWQQVVDNALPEGRSGRKPLTRSDSSSSVEGTSGAADSGSLRGGPDDAALGLGSVGLRKQVGAPI